MCAPPPGCVVSLQTFGAYGANFNPHAHALVSDGVISAEGEFLPLPAFDTTAVMEVFRRLLLERLHQAERLSENFMRNLLSWARPGSSVFAGPPSKPVKHSRSNPGPATSPVLPCPWTPS
jgi:hypothetical protein